MQLSGGSFDIIVRVRRAGCSEQLLFPFSGDPGGLPKQASDNGARSANQSPQSVGGSGIDSGVESTSDSLRDLPSIAISLCGGLSDHREITKGTRPYGTAPPSGHWSEDLDAENSGISSPGSG